MNVLGTTTMVKVGQKVPFKPAYLAALAVQLVMILAMPMLAFWTPEEVACPATLQPIVELLSCFFVIDGHHRWTCVVPSC